MYCNMAVGGSKITQEKLLNKSKSANKTKYWIHKFDKDLLRQLDSSKILGAEKQRSRGIKPIESEDKIILFSTLNIENKPTICFIAYTMVDDTFEDNKKLYNKYASLKKLKLKGIKYFTDPIAVKNFVKELNFTKNVKKSSNLFKSEYREINEEDFNKIIFKGDFSKKYPDDYDQITMNLDEFILYSMKGLYKVIKEIETKNQLEIKIFLKLLRKFLLEHEISKDLEELEEFYSHNAWKLKLKHNRSRDPDRSVILYNRIGKKRIFSYISLK